MISMKIQIITLNDFMEYMPDKPFRMLICGNSGSGKLTFSITCL